MGRRHADPHASFRAGLVCNGAFGVLDVGKDAVRVAGIGLALGREMKAARGPHDEAYAEPRLGACDDPADCRRRQPERPRRARQAALARDRHEGRHLSDPVDAISLHL